MRRIRQLALLTLASLACRSEAYYSTLANGNMLKEGHYKLGVETQFITDKQSGVDLGTRIEGPINEEMSWRGELGFGTTDFFGGGFVKWVPFPDYERQPAVGFLAGASFAHYDRIDFLSLRVHPFVSKRFDLEYGQLTPYATLPLGLQIADRNTDLTIQLALGSEYKPSAFEHLSFWAEIGFDMRKSFPYFSLAASLEWDDENGLQFK